MTRIVIASGNQGKVREIRRLLGGHYELLLQSEFNVPEADETGLSFVENAILKARNAATHTGLPAIGEDSGLEVDALDGAPGIHSARYAGADASDADNNRKLLAALSEQSNRQARYRCCAVVMRNASDPAPLIRTGTWEGHIAQVPSGDGGFGYDPIFIPADSSDTAAHLTLEEKNRVSHRADAFAHLAKVLAEFLQH
ncbi:MAG: RdgB/HAM1 family non-canonical purine NTP pyrophosphatase [Gammaproteobacteria bacterium]|nr:RdgB/HAM1 family non-canonical purine NTP pyrophosphatase [Gammaproteobacteria bacterium]